MADKTIGELPNLPAISPLDLLVAQHNEEATKITGATLTNFFKDYIGPVAATSASQMTNTNKVYIYIGNESGYTNGNWYYYNGSSWVSGGAYNSQAVNTDATLTHEGVPADAEAAGKIVEISETQPAAPANRVWIPETQEATVQVPTMGDINDIVIAGNRVLEVIKDSYYDATTGEPTDWNGWDRTDLIYIGDCAEVEIYLSTQSDYVVLFDNNKQYMRSIHVNAGRYTYNMYGASYIGISQNAAAMSTCEVKCICASTILGMPQKQIPANSDFNNYTTPGTYFVLNDYQASTMTNIPRNASGTLHVINRASENYKRQIYYPTSSDTASFYRDYNAGTWTDWQRTAFISSWRNIPMEVWDYTTLITTYSTSQYGQGLYARCMDLGPNLWLIEMYIDDLDLTVINTMLQIKFPNYVKDNTAGWIAGGTAYAGIQSLTAIQASGVGVYFRPNINKNTGSSAGALTALLFVRH